MNDFEKGEWCEFIVHTDIFMDTIAAIATARGAGGIGVIRISGSESIEIAEKVFMAIDNKPLIDLKGYSAKFGWIVENQCKIDESVALVFRAPHSYTGENIVELSCHGGIYITNHVLNLVIEAGATLAEPGEFTKRAFMNGKIDIIQAESIMQIISAKGKMACDIAFSAKEGILMKRVSEIKEIISSNLSHIMAQIDYPEDDIPQVDLKMLKSDIDQCFYKVNKLIVSSNTGKIIKDGISTVIIGKPNAGKSTLMNLLSRCERSIVTDIPGTTRDIVEESVMLGDIPLLLSDTAGIRESDDKIEKIGIKKARDKINNSQVIIAVFDGSSELSEEDEVILDDIKARNNVIAIVNKSDLSLNLDISIIEKCVDSVVYMSAINGEGEDKLKQAIYETLKIFDGESHEPVMFSQRLITYLKKAEKDIQELQKALKSGVELDKISFILEDVLKEINTALGQNVNEDIINEVFSRFCVGK